jgi:hypothetical protein
MVCNPRLWSREKKGVNETEPKDSGVITSTWLTGLRSGSAHIFWEVESGSGSTLQRTTDLDPVLHKSKF